jgi:hypothetical protein
VEFKIVQRPGVTVRVLGGRQEIEVGSGRMYALREGPNVPLSFDGLRAIAQTELWQFDVWAARPVTTTPGIFDDSSSRQFSVWGAYPPCPGNRGFQNDSSTGDEACSRMIVITSRGATNRAFGNRSRIVFTPKK